MDKNNTGEIIRSLRKSSKLSQNQFGKLFGYSARTVSDWEAGKTEPNITTIKAIVKYFEISYEEFFGEL